MRKDEKFSGNSFLNFFGLGDNEEEKSLSQRSSARSYGSYGSDGTTTPTLQKPKRKTSPQSRHDLKAKKFIEAVESLNKEKERLISTRLPEDGSQSTQKLAQYHNQLANFVRFYDSIIKMERGSSIEDGEKYNAILNKAKNYIEKIFAAKIKRIHTIACEKSFQTVYSTETGNSFTLPITQVSSIVTGGDYFEDLQSYWNDIRFIADNLIFLSAVAECSLFQNFMLTAGVGSFISFGIRSYADALKELKAILTVGFQNLLLNKEYVLGSFFDAESPYNIYASYKNILFINPDLAKLIIVILGNYSPPKAESFNIITTVMKLLKNFRSELSKETDNDTVRESAKNIIFLYTIMRSHQEKVPEECLDLIETFFTHPSIAQHPALEGLELLPFANHSTISSLRTIIEQLTQVKNNLNNRIALPLANAMISLHSEIMIQMEVMEKPSDIYQALDDSRYLIEAFFTQNTVAQHPLFKNLTLPQFENNRDVDPKAAKRFLKKHAPSLIVNNSPPATLSGTTLTLMPSPKAPTEESVQESQEDDKLRHDFI